MDLEPSAAALKQCKQSINKLMKKYDQTELTQPVFHYTSVRGACGILESKEFWMTKAIHLNDPSETRYGQQWLIDYAGNYKSNGDSLEHFWSRLPMKLEAAKLATYVTSFSYAGSESKHHWQRYGADNEGVCLEFSPEIAVAFPDSIDSKGIVFTTKLLYGEDEVRPSQVNAIHQIESCIRQCIPTEVSMLSQLDCNLMKSLAVEISILARQLAALIKDPCYEPEDEFRIFYIGEEPEKKFSSGKKNEREHIKASLCWTEKSPLKKIWIGANCNEPGEKSIREKLAPYLAAWDMPVIERLPK